MQTIERIKEKREKRKISWQAASEDLLAIIHITHKPIARLEAFMVVKKKTKKKANISYPKASRVNWV